MSVEKKTIRSDIPGHHTFLNGSVGYVGSSSEEARRMIVGRDIGLSGEISACEHLVVEGTVQAAMFTARRLDVLEPGLFAGAAEVQDAVIAGRFEGRLVVSGRLTVKSTGRLYGDIQYGVLEVEGGGRMEGQIAAVAAPEARVIETPQEPEVSGNTEPEVPNNVERLFDAKAGEREEGDGGEEAAPRRPQAFRRAIGY